MEVKDPATGQMITVPMRRDLPGYNVTRARKSPRMRWSLPVDIQWQSQCIMKFLGQSCGCCDLLTGGPNKENAPVSKDQLTRQRPRGLDAIIVDSGLLSKDRKDHIKKRENDVENTTTTTTIDYNYKFPDAADSVPSSLTTFDINTASGRADRFALDMFPGFPIPTKTPGLRQKTRRRKQLLSTTEMLMPQSEPVSAESGVTQTPFDVMQSHVSASNTQTQEVTSQVSEGGLTPLPDIVEEETVDKV